MRSKATTEEQRKEARRAYMREYQNRRYAESEEYREMRRGWSRAYCSQTRAIKESIYLNDFHQLDRRVRYIGCRLETDKDTMEVTGKSVVLKDRDLRTVWEGRTYVAGLPWLKAVANAYKQFRRFRREMVVKRKKEGTKNA